MRSRRRLTRIGIVGLLLCVALVALVLSDGGLLVGGQQASAQNNENLAKNGSFEESDKGLPVGWQLGQKADKKGIVSVVASNAQSGRAALRLAPNSRNIDAEKSVSPLSVGQGFPADPFRGKKLYVSAWMAAEGKATAVVGLYAFRKDGKVLGVRLTESAGKRPAFNQDVLEIPADGNTQFIVLQCAVEGQEGAAYFDDVYLGTQPGAAPAPAAKAAESGPLTATISVDAARDVRRIPRTLYGTNLEWIWDGNGLWDRKRDSLNADIVRLTEALNVSLLRFPGGIFADFYRWRDGVGPRSSRRETAHMPGSDSKSQHVFGTDEALELSARVGAPLLITVNIATGTPQEAADWVRYVNAGGAPTRNAPRVDVWELGNENYINGDAAYLKASSLDAQHYAQRVLEFARAMRQADPKIRLAAIAEENFPEQAAPLHPTWLQDVVSKVATEIDLVAIHNAYAPTVPVDKGWEVENVYAAMLAAPLQVQRSLERVVKKIDAAAPARAGKINIAVTEWGPNFDLRPNSRFVDHVKTLGSAIYAADILRVLLSSQRTEVANFFKLNDQLFMGWIGPRGGTYIPKAPYYALQLYTRHFGDMVVASTATSPTYDTPGVGWVEPGQGVPYISAIASRSTDGKSLYALVINKHLQQPIKTEITVRGFRPSRQGTAHVLGGLAVDSNTGTELFKAPGITWAKQAASRSNRFDQGNPSEVEIKSTPFDVAGATFSYAAPPCSVTVLELVGSRQ